MYSVVVNDTEPIFVYCSSPEACDEYGMVGVVNPNATTSLDTFRTNAKNAGYVLQPGVLLSPFEPNHRIQSNSTLI